MRLVRTSLLNAVAVTIKLVTYAGLNKILAVYVGPSGYAVIGQFQNAVSMSTVFAGGAINPGVTKYTAEYFDDEARQRAVWRTAGTLSLASGALIAVLVALFHRQLAVLFLHDEQFAGVFLWFAAGFVLFVFNGLLLAILNGKKEIERYVAINIVGSAVGLLMTGFLAVQWGLYGALVALVVNQSLMFGVTLAVCRRTGWFRLRDLVGSWDRVIARRLAGFAVMALTSAIVMPASQIIVRDHLALEFGWQGAGYWQAVTKISDLYLMLVTTTLSVYYIPRLSEIRAPGEMLNEILGGYRLILPITALGALAIFLLRGWVIDTLFTREFADMRNLFGWQMIGDVTKIGSWILGCVLIGKARVKAYVVTEVVFGFALAAAVFMLTPRLGLRGAPAAFCLVYALHWITMAFLVRHELRAMSAVRTVVEA